MPNKDTAPHIDKDGDLICDTCKAEIPAKEEAEG
jgi:hypothetical protein